MKLLIVTQAVDADHQALGFFVEWIRSFASRCESVDVIGFRVGRHDLPPNVRIHDVRAAGSRAFRRLMRYWLLLKSLLPKNDAVMVHMSPEYLVAAWPLLVVIRKPAVLWYAHRAVTIPLRAAALIAGAIVTSAPGACRLKSSKLHVVGQGVPTNIFRPMTSEARDGRIVTVGRVTPIKRIELMVEALALVRAQGVAATLDVIGEAVYDSDRQYLSGIRTLIKERGLQEAVRFLGAVPYAEFPVRYARYALAFNMAPTGAPDKAAFEAMACGVPAVVSNANFRALLGPDADRCVAAPDAQDVARKTLTFLRHPDAGVVERLRDIVVRDHSLDAQIRRILDVTQSLL